mgnify:CR=1 FL=1
MLWNPARPLVFTHLVATADVRYSPRPRTRDSRHLSALTLAPWHDRGHDDHRPA